VAPSVRAYVPTQSLLDGSYKLPNVEREPEGVHRTRSTVNPACGQKLRRAVPDQGPMKNHASKKPGRASV
jgi:hypothetical protein